MPARASAALVCLVGLLLVQAARSETIMIDVNTNGTLLNRNLYGTTLSGGVATWPANSLYRDYQFQLSTASGVGTFDGFAVRLSASRKQNTPAENTLRASIWSGGIVPNPLLSDALTTVTIPNTSVPTSGFSNITLTGPSFTSAQTIGTTPAVFFFRIWAEGDGSNNGFASKIASDLVSEFQAITMSESAQLNGEVAVDLDNDGLETGETYDLISEVPEPATAGLALAGIVAAGWMVRRRRVSAS